MINLTVRQSELLKEAGYGDLAIGASGVAGLGAIWGILRHNRKKNFALHPERPNRLFNAPQPKHSSKRMRRINSIPEVMIGTGLAGLGYGVGRKVSQALARKVLNHFVIKDFNRTIESLPVYERLLAFSKLIKHAEIVNKKNFYNRHKKAVIGSTFAAGAAVPLTSAVSYYLKEKKNYLSKLSKFNRLDKMARMIMDIHYLQ